MIAPRSISLLQPPLPHNYGSCHFFFQLSLSPCLYSLPQPAQIYRAVLWLCKRHAGKEEGHGFYNCSSPMLTARAAKVTRSVWLSHVHGAPQHFVFITEHATHTRTHTHEHAHLIRLRAAFPASVQQNDHMYGHNHEISRRTQAVIILLRGALFLFMSFFFYCKTQWIGRGGGENRHWRKKTVNVRARA